MNPKTTLRLTVRLLALCVLCAAALLFSSPEQRVRAVVDSCIDQMNGCYYSCGTLPTQQEQDACRAQCEINYNYCNYCDLSPCSETDCELFGLPPEMCEDPDTIPERWPVVDKGRRCLQGCQIYIYTDPEAYTACKANCLAMYP